MKHATTLAAIILVVGAITIALLPRREAQEEQKDVLRAVASVYHIGEFARQVGGSAVDVVTTTPPGAEPHDYEPTPADIVTVRSARVFFFHGGGFDPWAERIAADVARHGVTVVNMMNRLSAVTSPGTLASGDPHVWLDPQLAQREVGIIRDTLVAVDVDRGGDYRRQAEASARELALLDDQYARGLATCALRTIVTSHDAFRYLADRYDLSVIPIAGVSPDEEPSPRRLGEIADLVRAQGVPTVFVEPLVSPRIAETIAREVGVSVRTLHPIEGLTGDERRAGETYRSLMEKNLQELGTALQCQT